MLYSNVSELEILLYIPIRLRAVRLPSHGWHHSDRKSKYHFLFYHGTPNPTKSLESGCLQAANSQKVASNQPLWKNWGNNEIFVKNIGQRETDKMYYKANTCKTIYTLQTRAQQSSCQCCLSHVCHIYALIHIWPTCFVDIWIRRTSGIII